ncbi:MAG: hypothetical protein JHC98_03980 [Thermoleophilaceae bacterium]|nr:hypothetical protein [Thermoleophilaceae bacterium]
MSNIQAISFFDGRGYQRQQVVHNLRIDFADSLSAERPDPQLIASGVTVRSASELDHEWIAGEVERTWKPEWLAEVKVALSKAKRRLSNPTAGAHFAIANDMCVAFAAWGVSRPHELGPAGTTPDFRRRGLGEALLWSCMEDQRGLGLTYGEIKWAGPMSWFVRRFNARFSSAYLTYSKRVP